VVEAFDWFTISFTDSLGVSFCVALVSFVVSLGVVLLGVVLSVAVGVGVEAVEVGVGRVGVEVRVAGWTASTFAGAWYLTHSLSGGSPVYSKIFTIPFGDL